MGTRAPFANVSFEGREAGQLRFQDRERKIDNEDEGRKARALQQRLLTMRGEKAKKEDRGKGVGSVGRPRGGKDCAKEEP